MYGQIKNAEPKRLFREGLFAMLDELKPEIMLVYDAMPKSIFGGLENGTRFIKYDGWITTSHK